MASKEKYAVLVRPLSDEEGGGYLALVPDLPGCASDGETMQEAINNVDGAIESWIEAAKELGREIPDPGASAGKWLQRVPRTLHATLKHLAEKEGVSFNSYITCILAESVGRKTAHD